MEGYMFLHYKKLWAKRRSRDGTPKHSKVPSYITSWWFQPPLKNISQNGNLLQIGVKIKKSLKPPSR